MKLDSTAEKVIRLLKSAGFGAWIVGGYVRDRLMGANAHDADICTSARPEQVSDIFCNYRVIYTGLEHGTVTVVIDGENIEITTLRAETGYADHRRPDSVVFITDIKEDLKRRDFTVNAMATDGGDVIDIFGGRKDIVDKMIRCVGEPRRRFSEDALRILRALRFAAKLDFNIEEETATAAHELRNTLDNVSRERVGAEISKLLVSPAAGRVVSEYGDILEAAVPCGAFNEKAAQRINKVPCELNLRFAALLYDVQVPLKVMRELRLPNALCRDVCGMITAAHAQLPKSPEEARKFLSDFGTDAAVNALKLRGAADGGTKEAEIFCTEVIERGDCISIKQLQINGFDVLELGINGEKTGEILNKALHAVMTGEVENERYELINYIERETNDA